MATTKKVKKSIKEDQLVTYAVRASGWAQEHFNQVIVGVVVLVAVIAVLVFTANSRQNAARQGERDLSVALRQFTAGDLEGARTGFERVDERFGGKNSLIARFYQAETELRQRNYTGALATYDSYLDSADDFPAFRESAVYGKALCYEGLEDHAGAAQAFVTLMSLTHEDDPRYLDSAFQAGEFFARAGNQEEAVKYYQVVSDNAVGSLKHRAAVAVSLMSQ